MKTFPFRLILVAVLFPLLSFAQTKDQYNHKSYLSENVSSEDVLAEICTAKNISTNALIAEKTRKSPNGYEHKKYSQSYNGLTVYGTNYIIHSDDEKVVSSNGYLASNININTTPQIEKSKALTIAKKAMKGKEYFEDRVEPIELMIIDRAFPKVSSIYNLVYKVEVYTTDLIDKKIFFIDAINGSIVADLPGLIHESTPAIAHTKYHGEQEIISELTPEGDYILQDLTRGDGITTLNYDLTPFRNSSTEWDLTNENQDEVALDAHYSTEKFYDMMLERLGWDGLDGNGLSMNPIVHAQGGNDYVNAYWDGLNAWFGNGDCHRGPLTTLEVVGHEFMHGITDYTSDLIYSSESGAINESMSDVFGKAVEYYFAPDEFDWQIGESFILTEDFEPFRYMNNPNLKEMPAYYDGEYWNDSNGVHTNSAIGNLWFYLLVEGKTDVTEMEESYSVDGIGMDKAIEIVWQVQSNYLTPTSTYDDYYQSSIDVTTSMFGDESPELQDVIEAWKAVGLPSSGGGSVIERDLSLTFEELEGRQCLNDEFLPFTVLITNLGSEDILSDENIVFTIYPPFDSGIDPVEVTIEEDILSGETLSFVFDDVFFISTIGFTGISANFLNVSDENNINNSAFTYIQNFDPVYYNLSTFLSSQNLGCDVKTGNYNLVISNVSCDPIPAGTQIDYTLRDEINNQILAEGSTVLDELLASSEAISLSITTNEEHELITTSAMTSTNMPDEITTNLNFINVNKRVEGEFSNTLENWFDVDDLLSLYNIRTNVEYDGNLYLAKSGELIDENFISCPDPLEDFSTSNDFNAGYGKISMCADLEELENPLLSFDLVQFRDDSDALPEFDGLRCRVKIAWETSGANNYTIIEGLEEGVEENISISLPSNYVGELSIEFLNLTGTFYSAGNIDEYLSYDVNLIRNLEIRNTTSTENEYLSEEINISPNPGKGLYFIDAPYEVQQIEIRDAQGKLLEVKMIENNFINLESLSNGYYILTLKLADGRQVSKSIVNVKI